MNHDPEIVRGTLSRVFDELRGILEAHGGTVEKFIGDAVMSVFGIPAAHDDDADRALRAAITCRDRVESVRGGLAIPVQLRIGIATGEVVADTDRREQYLATGTPMNLVARYQAAAAPNEILVDPLTRRLTGGAVEFGEPRLVDAKGFGTVTAWPALRLTSAVPTEHRGIEGRRAPFIGRAVELSALIDAFKSVALERHSRLITIIGPPGVGKSRLVSEFTDGLSQQSFRGHCLPYGQGITLYPIRQILRGHLGISQADDRADVEEKLQARSRALIAYEREREAVVMCLRVFLGLTEPSESGGVSGPGTADELRWGLRRYFERISNPCVIVVEDLHRGEDALLDLIENLSASKKAPVLIVCVARPEFAERRPEWAPRAAGGRTIDLRPLSDDQAQSLLDALDDRKELSPRTRADVVARAEGNPLFLEELLRATVDAEPNSLTASGGLARVPATLQGVIAARIDRVSPELKRVLNRASIVGRLFSTMALEAIGGEPVIPAALEEAVRRDLVVESVERPIGGGASYRFKHGLIRDVAYASVPKHDRLVMHENYGHWLEEMFGDRRGEIAEIIAHHAEEAFLLAAELALAEAETLGLRALELLNSVSLSAQHRQDPAVVGLYERAAAVASRLRSESTLRSDALAGRAVARFLRFGEHDGLEAVRDKCSGGPTSEPYVRLLLILGFQAMAEGRPSAYIPLIDEAVAAARELGDPNVVAEALGVRANASYQSGDAEEYLQRVDAAIAYARSEGASREMPRLLLLRYVMATRRGEFTLAMGLESEIDQLMPPLVPPADAGWAARRVALRHAIGDSAAAVRIARQSLESSREYASRMIVGLLLWHLGDALIEIGQCEEARDVLEEAIAINIQLGQRGQIPEVAARCARARLRLGDFGGARKNIALAEEAVLSSDLESAAVVALANAELAESGGDIDAADASFSRAISMLEPTLFRVFLAQVRTAYARFLLGQRRWADAREQLQAAQSAYTDQFASRRRIEVDDLLSRVTTRV